MAWRLLAQRLMEERQYALAERVLAASLQRSDADAATDLTLAEARWNQGKPVADILARVDAVGAVDPARRLDLARFYARTNQPDLAASQLRRMDGYFPAEAGTGAVWAQIAANWLERGRISEAGDVLVMLADRWPQHVTGRLLADYFEALGTPDQAGSLLASLPFQTRIDYHEAVFSDLVSRGDVDAALAWVSAHPEALRKPEVRAGCSGWKPWTGRGWPKSGPLSRRAARFGRFRRPQRPFPPAMPPRWRRRKNPPCQPGRKPAGCSRATFAIPGPTPVPWSRQESPPRRRKSSRHRSSRIRRLKIGGPRNRCSTRSGFPPLAQRRLSV